MCEITYALFHVVPKSVRFRREVDTRTVCKTVVRFLLVLLKNFYISNC